MSLIRLAAVGPLALALLTTALPATAQLNPFANSAHEFARADRERMYRSMIEVLAAQEPGRVAEWTSEDGTFGGASELLRVYTEDDMRCGELRHMFADRVADDAVLPDVNRYDIPACEVPDEGWKFAF